MSIIVAFLMTAVVLYCIGGCLMIKRVIEEAMDYIYDMPPTYSLITAVYNRSVYFLAFCIGLGKYRKH